LIKKSVERIEAFRADTYGRSIAGKMELEGLIARPWFKSRKEV